MARTKASQMARKYVNVEDSSGSSEESSGHDTDMVEGEDEEQEEQEQQEMGAGETGNKRKKRKSKKEKEGKKGRGKGPKEAPSHEELLDRLARKREADRLGAQRRKQQKQEEWDGMVALLEDLQAQLRTAKCLTPAIDQYYARHGLEGLETEQSKLAVLKWVGRDKSKAMADKSKAMADKHKKLPVPKPLQDRRVLTPSHNQPLLPLPSSTPSSKPHFRTSTPVRKSSLKTLNTSPTSKPLISSSSKLIVATSFKPLPSTTSKSLLSSGDDSNQTSPLPPPLEIQGSGLNTTSGSTAFSEDGSFMEF